MRDLLTHTQDAYEKRYGAEICKRFQRYKDFWNQYIGQRQNNALKHYEIDRSKTNIKNFDEKYEKMVLSHYGIFVDLAGIRIDLESLSKNHHKTIDEYLSHWNTIRNIYSKMGDSIYKYKSFLGCVKKILDLKDNTIKDIITELEKDLEPIKNKRDYATHFHPLPFVLDEDDNMRFPRRLYDGN